jgi:hypothetical protein
MSATAASILEQLGIVDAERRRRSATPGLNAKVATLKEYQQLRFSHTYADLLETARYGAASRFFLDELYGPSDFTRRDAEFARVVPGLVRLFPNEIVETVATLAELHALSESLDTAMATQLEAAQMTARSYVHAWQCTGRAPDRDHQIALTLTIADRLDVFTRKRLIRNSLRLMRGPARIAGLAELHQVLENGFDAFRAMDGAQEFIAMIDSREHALASALFSADTRDLHVNASLDRALANLP